MQTVLDRLGALERSNRRMKFGLALALCAACAAACAATEYESLSAKRIVLVGENGAELATLLREGGGARLVLNADDKRARVVLDVNGVRVFDALGRVVWRSQQAPSAAQQQR